MMLHLYIITTNHTISAHELASPGLVTYLQYIEVSGFGNILGIRRDNVEDPTKKCIKYKATRKKVSENNPLNENNDSNKNTDNDNYEVIRQKHCIKYKIPYVCKNILIALLKSREENPYILKAKDDESITEKTELLAIFKYLDEILAGEYKDSWTFLKKTGGDITLKCAMYGLNSDFSQYDIFYKSYYNKLEKTRHEKKEKESNKDRPNNSCLNLSLSDNYLSELLFATQYYIKTLEWYDEIFSDNIICEEEKKQFLDIVYLVSESMLCYTRIKSIKMYGEKYLSTLKNKTISSQETLLEEITKIKNVEQYTNQKFVPALYYCFLYFFMNKTDALTNEIEASSLSHTIRNLLSKSEKDFTQLETCQLKKWLSCEDIKSLLYRRKTEYFKPLDYKDEKALF